MYLSLALFAEGTSDYEYLEPILVRSLEDIAAREIRRTIDLSQTVIRLSAGARDVDRVSAEICAGMANPPPFHIVFIHAADGQWNAVSLNEAPPSARPRNTPAVGLATDV